MFRKRDLYALSTCLIISSSALAQSGETTLVSHYYYFDQRIDLNVSEDVIAIQVRENVTSQERASLVSSDASLDEIIRDDLPERLALVKTIGGLGDTRIKEEMDRLALRSDVSFVTPVFERESLQLVPLPQIVLRFKDNVTENEIRRFLTDNDLEIVRKSEYRSDRFVLCPANAKSQSILHLANTCNSHPQIQYAAPDFCVVNGYQAIPNDTYFSQQWPHRNIGQDPPNGLPDADMDSTEGWDIEIGNSNIVIAIIDSGTDINHEDLADNIWTNQEELNGVPNVDDDGNGFIDDIHGWNFESNNNNPLSSHPHGTAVAGMAGAVANNGIGVSGVAWNCTLMPLKIGTGGPIPSAAADAIDYASANNADVLNNSYSLIPHPDVTNAISSAKTNGRNGKGCVIVFASGNGFGAVSYPATLDDVIAVGATDENDQKWSYSNYGPELDVVAPSADGVNTILWTTDISGTAGYNWGDTSLGDPQGDYTKWFGGTSAACPEVAGLAGLILSRDPLLTSDEVQTLIEESADDLGATGYDNLYGWGRVNVFNALIATLPMEVEKLDDVADGDCVSPDEGGEITYTICWENLSSLNVEDVVLIDYLPAGVTYDPIISWSPLIIDPNYDFNEHSYTWPLGTVGPNDSGCVSLTVEVNEGAEPGMTVNNVTEMLSGQKRVGTASEQTSICCWGDDPNIIYVDKSANGGDSGVDWFNAYSGQDALQKALQRALALSTQSVCAEKFTIYVAGGTYNPGPSAADTFALPEGTVLYGGFRPGGTDFTSRNPDKYRTLLTGILDPNFPPTDTVITMLDDPLIDANSLLDGVFVRGGELYGVYGSGIDFTVENSRITNSRGWGMYAENGDVAVRWCSIKDNHKSGIEHRGDGYLLTVENSRVSGNLESGFYTTGSTPTIKNSVVFRNGLFETGFHGVNLVNPMTSPVLYNNTIVGNRRSGIAFSDNQDVTGDPNAADWPDVKNCILWNNDNGGDQVAGFSQDTYVWYSCVQDANSVNFNINVDPGFAHAFDPNAVPDPNHLPDPNTLWHLAWNSPCKDAGHPQFDADDVGYYDLDGEDRFWDGRVDIGADEVATCDGLLSEDDIYNPLDWNADGLVNYQEFTAWSGAWLSHDPNDPAVIADPNTADPNDLARWNPEINLVDTGDSTYVIDLPDLVAYIQDGYWLWTACWKQSQWGHFENMMMAMSSSGGEMSMYSALMELESSFASTDEESSSELDLSTAEIVSLAIAIDEFMQKIDELLEEGVIEVDEFRKTRDILADFLLELEKLRK